jgi:hypothetical protein
MTRGTASGNQLGTWQYGSEHNGGLANRATTEYLFGAAAVNMSENG